MKNEEFEYKTLKRVFELIKRFNRGETINKNDLANDPIWREGKIDNINSIKKKIDRDIKFVKNYFPDYIQEIKDKKRIVAYKAYTKELFNNFIEIEDKKSLSLLLKLFNILQLNDRFFDIFNLKDDDKKLIKKEMNELDKCYVFKNRPFEDFKDNMKKIEELEKTILNKKFKIVKYKEKDEIREYKIRPYKIMFINENFYLICATEKYSYTLLRISKIEEIRDCEDKLKIDEKKISEIIEDFIPTIQTPFADLKKIPITVKIEVEKDKAHFFKLKKHLNSQKILETKPNGNLIISYNVTQEKEIEELIKKWIPHIRIIEPQTIKENIQKQIDKYLKWQSE